MANGKRPQGTARKGGAPKKRWTAAQRAARQDAQKFAGRRRTDERRPQSGSAGSRRWDDDERREQGRKDGRRPKSNASGGRSWDRDDRHDHRRTRSTSDSRRDASQGSPDGPYRGQSARRADGWRNNTDGRSSGGREGRPNRGQSPRHSDRWRDGADGRSSGRRGGEPYRDQPPRRSDGWRNNTNGRSSGGREARPDRGQSARHSDRWKDSADGRSSSRREGRSDRRRPEGERTRSDASRPNYGSDKHRSAKPFEPERNQSDTMEWSEPQAVDVDASPEIEGGFAALGVHPKLAKALARDGIVEPFPIQRATIADGIDGRDVLGRGRTGSGKTLAFGLSLLTRLAAVGVDTSPGRTPVALILLPTRELALQVADVLGPLAKTVGLFPTLVTGGMSYGPQQRAFERGVDVVIATPGRLIDLLEQEAVDLSAVRIVVLDEADQMSDMGFLPDVRKLLNHTQPSGQRMLFSATLDAAVSAVVDEYLDDPAVHEVDSANEQVATMTHHLIAVAPAEKWSLAAQIIGQGHRSLAFVRTQQSAERTAEELRGRGILAGALHGGMTQGARRRALDAFRAGKLDVLVATDVAARGIDVDDVDLVLQIDPPREAKDYTHRAGRTARAGASGTVATLVLPHQRKFMTRLAREAGVPRPGQYVAATDVPGAPAAGEPISDERYRAIVAPQPAKKSAAKPRRGKSPAGRRGGATSGRGQSARRRHDER